MTLENRIRDNLNEAGTRIRVPDHGDLRSVPPRRPSRRPLLAFAAGVLGVGVLGLLLWLAGPGNEELPPELLTADSVELEWSPVEGIETDSDSVVFAHGADSSLAIANSWSQESGTTVEGVYRTDNGVRWERVNSQGPDGVDRLAAMVSHAEGFVVSGLHLTGGSGGSVPQPALWSSADGVEWDLTLLPVPEAEDPSDIVAHGVGPLAVDATGGVALGEALRLGPESEETPPSFDEGGTPQPQQGRTYLWETDATGEWLLADGAPQDPAALGTGPAGLVVIAATSDGTAVWQREGQDWVQTTTLPDRATLGGMLANQTGYLMFLEDGAMLFSTNARDWSPIQEPSAIAGGGAGAGGFVVASFDPPADPSIWWSGNGTDWTEIATGDNLGIGDIASIHSLTATTRSIIVAGRTETSGTAGQGFITQGTISR